LSIVPFEKAWYAKHAPELKVEFVGNPVVERYSGLVRVPAAPSTEGALQSREAQIALFPGSRPGELRRHVPVMLEVAHRIRAARSAKFRMVVPNEALAALAQTFKPDEHGIELSVGRISEVLQQIDLAITKSGTITLECAYFGVPAIVFYKTSSLTYQIGRRLVKVQNLAMPNLLADENIFPEFVQDTATPESITAAALEILQDPARNSKIKAQLAEVVKKLGAPGASERAARAILNLVRR